MSSDALADADLPAVDDIDRSWWQESVVYQVFPRSFNDSDGDGIGDIPGILNKLDYLDELGVDVLWLSPVYDSPFADSGYDIRDYRAIADVMGDTDDWERLRDGLHERDMKLVMDLVVNHTSDEHEWFQKSRRREDGYEDYYYWRNPDDGGPPNNWFSLFGGPAWTYDDEREQYYLHLFDAKQPDLNWRNPRVREAIHEMIRWWMDRGVDGWRMDAISVISKPEGLPDSNESVDWFGADQFFDGPNIHEYLSELFRDVIDDYDAMTIGETPGVDVEQARAYLNDGFDMLVHFDHMDVTYAEGGKWDLSEYDLTTLAAADNPDALLNEWDLPDLKAVMDKWIHGLGFDGWNTVYLGSHDQIRVLPRFGDPEHYRRESGTLIATFLLTVRATPLLYQGDEFGMTNPDWRSIDELDDVETRGHVRELIAERSATFDDLRPIVRNRSRDSARTPMQWDDSENAGFTDGEPWLRINDNYETVNATAARADTDSIWHHYRELIERRSEHPVLVYGAYEDLLSGHEQLYAYTRTLADSQALVLLNWSDESARFDLPAGFNATDATVIIGNYDDVPADPDGVELRPYEAVIYRVR